MTKFYAGKIDPCNTYDVKDGDWWMNSDDIFVRHEGQWKNSENSIEGLNGTEPYETNSHIAWTAYLCGEGDQESTVKLQARKYND